MSPAPSKFSAPGWSMMVMLSTRWGSRNEMRVGKLALTAPVTNSVVGRWVAMIIWMPTARALCASRRIWRSNSSRSVLGKIVTSSAYSSMATTMCFTPRSGRRARSSRMFGQRASCKIRVRSASSGPVSSPRTLIASSGSVTMRPPRRCGSDANGEKSMALGSMMTISSWSGDSRQARLSTAACPATVLPAPLAPAKRMCGSVARSSATPFPAGVTPTGIQRPGATSSLGKAAMAGAKVTICRSGRGKSTATCRWPGIWEIITSQPTSREM